MKTIFILIVSCSLLQAQSLHHEMLSSQVGYSSTSNGLNVIQTVGQQSIIGTYIAPEIAVQQGFLQSLSKLVTKSRTEDISVILHPNPVVDIATISFSSSPGPIVSVFVYDILGRFILKQDIANNNNLILIDLKSLPSSKYIVKVYSSKIIFSKTIIKN